MKLVTKLSYAGPAVLLSLLFAAPAFAQFEVNPDHFDNTQTTNSKKTAQKAKGQQAKQDASKQPAGDKSSTSAAASASSTSQATQSSRKANRTSVAAKSSGPSSTRLQSHGKAPTVPADRHLSARVAAPAPQE